VKGAIVTGGTRGLGRDVSLRLCRAGFRVHAIYGSDGDSARVLATEAAAEGLHLECLPADLREPAQIDSASRGVAEMIVCLATQTTGALNGANIPFNDGASL
jgi:NAD(P)-dependent dehydrogenase (short-subunit alcohol dehydrogenase family)